jgi:hypothetical protein
MIVCRVVAVSFQGLVSSWVHFVALFLMIGWHFVEVQAQNCTLLVDRAGFAIWS